MIKKVTGFLIKHFSAVMIGVFAVLLFFITAGMINGIKSNIDNINIITPPSYTDEINVPAAALGEEYIVKEYDGRIGVFVLGDTVPIRVVQVYVMYLPESDREELRSGITVVGARALENLIDDFRS